MAERALVRPAKEAVLTQAVQNSAYILHMLRRGTREDKNVVKINNNGDIKQIREYGIHGALERRWCVGEAERHYGVLEQAITCAERRFLPVIGLNLELVEPLGKVHLGEKFGAKKTVEYLIDPR